MTVFANTYKIGIAGDPELPGHRQVLPKRRSTRGYPDVMPDRFFAPGSLDGPVIELSPDESRHMAGVLRKTPGETVVVFNGAGAAAEAVVEAVGKRACSVRIVQVLPTAPQRSPGIQIASAAPKGDRIRWLIEKATELGADRWTPLQLTRSVVDPGDGKLERLRQTVIAACKQCERNRLMEIAAATTWPEWLAEASAHGTVIVAHPTGVLTTEAAERLEVDLRRAGHAAIAIGPEGGFTEDELEAAVRAGALVVNLGPQILRIETAAIAALAWLRLAFP